MAARSSEHSARRSHASVPYPAHWEADIALRDGSAAHLRPILPSDAEALQRFHRRQSEQSRYLRFFAPMPELSPRDLERFTVVDHRDRVALVVLHGQDIIAVGRYDRIAPAQAEVAFNVSDHDQGKGLGSVLLEHLAAAAREVGIDTFVAEVLPQNHRMLSVFTDAGFDVQRRYDDGVVLVSVDIDPTDRSEAVRAEREHRAEARAMERMLSPTSVLIAGVSARRDSVGGRFLHALEGSGYAGGIHVVTHDAFEVGGHPAHSRIEDVPGPVDMAVLALRPEDCLAAIEPCAAIGVSSLVIPTEGFAESGAEGARAQRTLVSRARRAGMRVLGPAAFGFCRTGGDPIDVSFAPRLPTAGATALAGQSSALAAMVLTGAEARGIGVHEFVGAGNRADVSINDCLQHWEDHPEVRTIALALESMGNPRKFTRIARRLTRSVPVVVLRPPGLTSDAPPGHDVRSSSLPRPALDQVLAEAGVVGTSSVDHLLDVTQMLDREGVPRGRRVGLLANTPALGAALRGAADAAGLEVASDVRHLPVIQDERQMVRAVTRLAAPGGIDLLVVGILDPLGGDLSATVAALADVARGSAVAVSLCVVTEPSRYRALQDAVQADHRLPPLHPTPALAVRAAAGAMAAIGRPLAEEEAPARREDIDRARARHLVEEALRTNGGDGHVDLDAEAAAALLACYGLDLLDSRVVHDEDEAVAAARAIGFPVALKSTDPILAHRSDLGGVRLDLGDEAQLRRAVTAMRRDLSASRAPLRVQAMAPPGVPVVVRTTEDPALGPVVSFSVAGDATDLLGDIAYAIPPLSPAAARRLIAQPATAVRLDGGPSLPVTDRAGLVETVVAASLLAEDLPEVRSLELYPVIVSECTVSLAGASVRLAHAPNRTDGSRRSLPGGMPEAEVPHAATGHRDTPGESKARGRMAR